MYVLYLIVAVFIAMSMFIAIIDQAFGETRGAKGQAKDPVVQRLLNLYSDAKKEMNATVQGSRLAGGQRRRTFVVEGGWTSGVDSFDALTKFLLVRLRLQKEKPKSRGPGSVRKHRLSYFENHRRLFEIPLLSVKLATPPAGSKCTSSERVGLFQAVLHGETSEHDEWITQGIQQMLTTGHVSCREISAGQMATMQTQVVSFTRLVKVRVGILLFPPCSPPPQGIRLHDFSWHGRLLCKLFLCCVVLAYRSDYCGHGKWGSRAL